MLPSQQRRAAGAGGVAGAAAAAAVTRLAEFEAAAERRPGGAAAEGGSWADGDGVEDADEGEEGDLLASMVELPEVCMRVNVPACRHVRTGRHNPRTHERCGHQASCPCRSGAGERPHRAARPTHLHTHPKPPRPPTCPCPSPRPQDLTRLDPAVLSTLPTSLQLELLERMRDAQAAGAPARLPWRPLPPQPHCARAPPHRTAPDWPACLRTRC